MAVEDLNISPSQGAGDHDVSVGRKRQYDGRLPYKIDVTFRAPDVEDQMLEVNIMGRPEWVEILDEIAAHNDGDTLQITGSSNASKLTFTLGSGDLNIELPETYLMGGMPIENGEDLPNDPGAYGPYAFEIIIEVEDNVTIQEYTRQLIVTTTNGASSICQITQAGDPPSLNLSTDSITLDYTGTPQTIQLFSNTNWEVVGYVEEEE